MKKMFFLGLFLFVNSMFTLSAQQSAKVSGKITSADGDPLSDVSIVVNGSTNGATTDQQGDYQMMLVDGNYMLNISLVGYKASTYHITVQGKNQELNFTPTSRLLL